MSSDVDLSQLAIQRNESSGAGVRARRPILTRYVLPMGLAAGFLCLIGWATRDFVFPPRPVKVIPVLVSHAQVQQSGTPLFKAAGWIQPRPTAVRVAALAPGVVQELLVVEDQPVQKDEPIARLVSDDAQLALERAMADFKLREAERDEASATLTAAKTKYEKPVHLQAPLAEAEAQLAEIETELSNLPFEIRRAELQESLAEQDLASKLQAQGVVSGIEIDEARSRRDRATAVVEELRKRQKALSAQHQALVSRRDALQMRLHLRADEMQAVGEAQARVKAAEARLEKARVAQSEAQLRRDRMTVYAPIDGRVLRLVAEPGTRLMADMGHREMHDASTVVTLYRPEMLQVRVDVRFEELPRVQLNQPVRIECPALSSPLNGEVLFVSSLADIQKNTLEVKVLIHQPPPVLKPEMLVDVTFLAAPQPESQAEPSQPLRLLVPRALVQRDETGIFVWVADQNAGVARRVPVETGPTGAHDMIEVVQGLTAASRLITSGLDGLQDGHRIRVTQEDEHLGSSNGTGNATGGNPIQQN